MEKQLKFKTSINCGGCVAKVTPLLNAVEGIENWNVDTNNPDKVLTVTTALPQDSIVETVKKAGFKIEAL
ncbi:cation transporter [Flavobacterium sp. RNTU_13]|uniref:cation transporter n=1 Tax=Flavobacterium sp. RNTU_13 TaxID=3375145 RepID=UPI00398798D1